MKIIKKTNWKAVWQHGLISLKQTWLLWNEVWMVPSADKLWKASGQYHGSVKFVGINEQIYHLNDNKTLMYRDDESSIDDDLEIIRLS